MDETKIQQYTARAKRLRSEGRLEEAILAARKATQLGENDANAWWLLGLSLRDKDGPKAALEAMEKVTELAPHHAPGWCELGKAHQDAGHVDEAIVAYEEALNTDEQHVPSMRLLVRALRGRDDASARSRRLELLHAMQQHDAPLEQFDQFDFAFLLAEANEYSHAAREYETYTRQYKVRAAYYNLALAYERLGRDADALDALTEAQRIGPQDDKVDIASARIVIKLRALRERVLQRPQPYLPDGDWYQHYVSPFALLNVYSADDVTDVKALQKAKQALLREIDLEDGKVGWLPGLVLDKSSALARLEAFNGSDAWEGHSLVFQDKDLCDFLQRGHLGHFLLQHRLKKLAALPHEIDPSVLQVIGQSFASQYNKVFSRALEQGDLDVVECLLDGRRMVLPEQEEQCYEGAKRVLERLREPLVKLVGHADKRTVTRREVELALADGTLGGLLGLLPVEFHETHVAVGRALRELSVRYFNREHDADEAMAILQLGKPCAEKSPSLAHQLSEDERALGKIIAEERSKEAHLDFGQTKLHITKKGVVYGVQAFAVADIEAVRWGLVQTSVTPSTVRHSIAFRARSGQEIVVSWTTSENLEQQNKHWQSLVSATLHFVIPVMLATLLQRLEAGTNLRVGPVEVVRDGVIFDVQGWFSTKRVLTEWFSLQARLVNGNVVLRDARNSKATATLPLETTYNAIVLHMLATPKESTNS